MFAHEITIIIELDIYLRNVYWGPVLSRVCARPDTEYFDPHRIYGEVRKETIY
jgi:hypothetical protein